MINRRTMGEDKGYWYGVEVEHTPFYGMETIFFSRFLALELDEKPPHIFIALCNPKFFNSNNIERQYELTMMYVDALLRSGKYVTIECTPQQATDQYITRLRQKFPKTFCLLVAVEIPKVEAGAFAIKAAPSTVFEDGEHEGCVMTASWADFTPTYWPEYAGDKDGQ